MEGEQRVIRVSKKRLIFWIVLIIILLGGWFFFGRFYFGARSISVQERGSVSAPSIAVMDGASERGFAGSDLLYPEPYPYPYPGDPDITDTREFLKTSYSAEIESREVQDVVEEVEDAVRDADGRIDDISSSEKYGHVSFVIPKDELEDFREEIAELVDEELFVETITSTNLLAQKQNIEGRTEDTEETLEELESEESDLDATHTQATNSLQFQINVLKNQLNAVDVEKAGLDAEDEDYEEDVVELEEEEISLEQKLASLEAQLANENRVYVSRNNSLVLRINTLGGNLELLEEEDEDFMNDIDTVEGYINVRWINLWDLAERFTPTPMWLNTGVVVLLVLWYLKRRRIIPKIELT